MSDESEHPQLKSESAMQWLRCKCPTSEERTTLECAAERGDDPHPEEVDEPSGSGRLAEVMAVRENRSQTMRECWPQVFLEVAHHGADDGGAHGRDPSAMKKGHPGQRCTVGCSGHHPE